VRPGGHLVTAVGLGALAYAKTGSTALAAGCVAGAFLIDADHYLDYLTVEGQWRRPSPLAFLRYAFAVRTRRHVLPLHSLELMVALVLLARVWPEAALLVGYVAGAMLHLLFDIAVNGEHLRQPLLFYWFGYRAWHGFAAHRLIAPVTVPPDAGRRPVREFFTWRPAERPLAVPDTGETPAAEIAPQVPPAAAYPPYPSGA
jgi:hypothetical protein